MRLIGLIVGTCLFAAAAAAQPDPSGIEFVTITHANNPAWAGDGTPSDLAIGRGSVGHEYRIGKFEVTTGQWAEFMNAAHDRAAGDLIPHVVVPAAWGAVGTTPQNLGGRRWEVPAGREMLPTGGIDWRTAAIYCNWLHNDKATNREAFLNGAYDVSTFGYTGTVFTDQLTHHTNARYWIPTWDEWLKATHWSPTNPDNSGWFPYANSSNTPLAYGPPGLNVRVTGGYGPDPNGPLAKANAGWDGFHFPGHNPFSIPLGSYGNSVTPWGLLDAAGGTREWTEEVGFVSGIWPTFRVFDGSAWASSQAMISDEIYHREGDFPSLPTYDLGFRIAAAIPTPPTCVVGGILGMLLHSRRRERRTHEQAHDRIWHVRGSWGGGRSGSVALRRRRQSHGSTTAARSQQRARGPTCRSRCPRRSAAKKSCASGRL